MNSKPYDFTGFVGDFAELIIQFVQFKQSQGFDYKTDADMLKRFSKFTLNYTVTNHELTKELVDEWTAKRPAEMMTTWEGRTNNLRQFAKFLNDLGYKAYIPFCRAKIDRSYVPHIFTHEQLRSFFYECETIKPHPRSNKHIVLPALFRLLYGCGLRISEALALKMKNVDLDEGIICIRGSKFDKDRLLPMSHTLSQYLNEYAQSIHAVSSADDYFFMKKDRTEISSSTVYKHFRKILWKSGISHGGKGRGPRLHDFRHSFSVHSLNQMVRKGIDLYCALPILATYLGHNSVTATERYLRLTEEAYPGIMDAVSQTCAYVFPEVRIK